MNIIFPLSPIIIIMFIIIIVRIVKFNIKANPIKIKRFERVKPLYDKLEEDEPITEDDVLPYAKNFLTREMAFELLNEYDKTALFPEQYYSIVNAAESNLASWLETELNICPDVMEYINRVSFSIAEQYGNFAHYEVFKYRTFESSNPTEENNWFYGVVGPYFDDSSPFDIPQYTFSSKNSLYDSTFTEEAKWVHENMSDLNN